MVRGLLDSAATLLGPTAGGAAARARRRDLGVRGGRGGLALGGRLLLPGLRYDAPPRPAAAQGTSLLRAAADGIRAVGRNADLALIMGLAVAQSLIRGALTVLTIVVAIDLLDTGEPGVGLLNAAIGAGAVLGSLAAVAPGRHAAPGRAGSPSGWRCGVCRWH